jgi:hypothetical protein
MKTAAKMKTATKLKTVKWDGDWRAAGDRGAEAGRLSRTEGRGEGGGEEEEEEGERVKRKRTNKRKKKMVGGVMMDKDGSRT